jgi:hypothetical protein
MGTEEQRWLPRFDYYIDESDPDVVVLRRQDGAFVAAFSAQGATREGILEATSEDFAMEYPCHSPTERRWFLGKVGRLSEGDTPLALVAQENVTGGRIRR